MSAYLSSGLPDPVLPLDEDWDKIIDAQQANKCILILGPDVITIQGKTLFEFVSESIFKKHSGIKIFSNEQLLHIPKENAIRNKLRFELNDFYEKCNELKEVYELVALLPFHLILSFIPHDGLFKTIRLKSKYGSKAKFGFQPVKDPPISVAEPTKEQPLVYNMLPPILNPNISNKTIEQPLLTFEDLFDYISGVLGARELPTNLQYVLGEAITFVFLGVPFENWYTHLLLKKICGINATYLKAYESGLSEKTRTFVVDNFSLDFMDIDPKQFLKDWHAKLKKMQDETILESNSDHYGDFASEINLNDKEPISVFISYAHNNINEMTILKNNLEAMYQKKLIIWTDVRLEGGEKWSTEIENQIKKARIILLILTWDYLRSSYCWYEELKYALDLYKDDPTIRIIPIMMGECPWGDKDLPDDLGRKLSEKFTDAWKIERNLANLQAIPTNSKGRLLPIDKWPKRDYYWTALYNQMQIIIKNM
ncbi:TIR domain-containing protein [Spirosoma sp. HMF4905]|uniref:TIR domain-containing protein n=1 Tax=Spirosoma arboris TaxID=2682092 RepID=A0A7K1SKN5_9BACT|nr:toll/interleukin-1 receptor domain-containing protein [Spirosoma arboris]MVM34156.1 TIR domain-containing protein [Spirosoma arboris]